MRILNNCWECEGILRNTGVWEPRCVLCNKLYSKGINNERWFYFYNIRDLMRIRNTWIAQIIILTLSLGLNFNVTLREVFSDHLVQRGLSISLLSLFLCVLTLFPSEHFLEISTSFLLLIFYMFIFCSLPPVSSLLSISLPSNISSMQSLDVLINALYPTPT